MAAPFPSPRHFSLVFLGFVGCRRVALWLRSSVCQDMTSSLSKLCFLLQAVLWVGFWLSSSFGKNNSTTFKKSLKITACYKIPPKKWYHVAGNEVESGGGWGQPRVHGWRRRPSRGSIGLPRCEVAKVHVAEVKTVPREHPLPEEEIFETAKGHPALPMGKLIKSKDHSQERAPESSLKAQGRRAKGSFPCSGDTSLWG